MGVPEHMEALLLRRPGLAGLELTRVPVPAPGDGEVLVALRAAGIGGTVLKRIQQPGADKLPLIPGHEGVGDVVAVGPGVTTPRIGDRVLLYYYLSCGTCRYCLAGRWPLCRNTGDLLYPRLGYDRDGVFAPYTVVPARNALPAPDGLDDLAATVSIDAVATPLHICRRARIEPGEQMLIVGAAGGVGVHLIQVAKRHGAHVTAVDMRGKLEALTGYGAEALVDASVPDWGRALAGGFDVVVDCVGTQATTDAAFDALGRGGRLVVLTAGRSADATFRSFHRMIAEERSILGSKYTSPAEVIAAADALARGDIEPVISRVVTLDEAPRLLEEIERGSVIGRGAVTFDAATD